MTRLAFITARAAVAIVCLLTWAYGLIVSVRFAFEQFIRPQLFPWVTDFVTWHHAWYWAAFAVSVGTIAPQLRGLTTGQKRVAAWLALGYVLSFGAIGIFLIANPFLAMLDGGTRSTALVPGALIPLLWLAAIDHFAVDVVAAGQHRDVTGQRRVFAAAIATAAALWTIHVVIAATRSDLSGGWSGWLSAAIWALVLDVTAAAVVAVALGLVAGVAAAMRRPFAWEYVLTVALIAAVITEFVRRFILPSLTFTGADAAISAIPLGIALAAMWSGWRVRLRHRDATPETALGFLLAPFAGRSARSVIVASIVPVAAAIATRLVETVDWALVMNRLIALVEATLIFGFFLSWFRNRQDAAWSVARAVLVPLAALAALWLLPWATSRAGAWAGNAQIDSELALDRLPTTDPLAATVARLLVEQQPPDMEFHREMIALNSAQAAARPAVPAATFARESYDVGSRPPHVFIFLIDSLRRDYLSAYNPGVTFTPALDALARDSYVFSNAFTVYGGTWMAIPSMWSGAPLTRGWGQIFNDINVIEPLIRSANYDFLINDYTVESELEIPRTFLNPGITSVNTDLCDNVAAIQAHIDGRRDPSRSTFAFLAPMNVHILNTRNDAAPADPRYAGFYPSYAARLERLDGCFGTFISYLQQRGLYDDSIIIVTSDHGDTLGTDGNWGHQFFLFPEDVRIPLIVRLPPSRRATVTTDLARIALLPDVAPTLLALLGVDVPDLDPPFASSLFVGPEGEPRPRRRDSFLLMSSYGATYGLLRRNGRFLYISDLVSWREYAYTLFKEPLGERAQVTDAQRRIGQAGIRRHAKAVDELYGSQ